MAMIEGTVTINPVTGAIVAKVGCAGEVFDAMDSTQDYGDTAITNPLAYAVARQQIANMAIAVAKVIPHIQNNGVVTTTVATGIAVATTGTASAQTGSTTSTGTGTGSVA